MIYPVGKLYCKFSIEFPFGFLLTIHGGNLLFLYIVKKYIPYRVGKALVRMCKCLLLTTPCYHNLLDLHLYIHTLTFCHTN